MTLSKAQKEGLARKLELTEEKELDCDEVFARMAEYVEGKPLEPELRALIEHHLEICSECAEELAILKKALAHD